MRKSAGASAAPARRDATATGAVFTVKATVVLAVAPSLSLTVSRTV